MRAAVAELAACLDEAVSVQERLLDLVTRQRPAIVGARPERAAARAYTAAGGVAAAPAAVPVLLNTAA